MQNPEEILDFAIREEEKAAAFYAELAQRTKNGTLRKLLRSYEAEELQHKAKLLAVKAGEIPMEVRQAVLDLRISDYVVEVEASPEMDYQTALIAVIQREKAAIRLYQDLAAKAQGTDLESVFLALAQEEARHKLRFEMEYDELVLRDN
jgi:rubrerythrin